MQARATPHGQFRLGLAVWGFDKWIGGFLPAGVRKVDMLRRFAERVHTVESNDTFYGVAGAEALQRRAAQTPEGFQFCPKIPRTVSHEGGLSEGIVDALGFFDHMSSHLGDRLGPVFLQLPPSCGPSQGPDLARLLNAWRRHTPHRLMVEVRHRDWFRPDNQHRLDRLLARLGMGRVTLDTRPIYAGPDDPQADNPRKKPQVPLHAAMINNTAMVRFISHPDAERNTPWLTEWAERVHRWLDAGQDVYFFVHCPREEFSPDNARKFQHMLEQRAAPVSPLPWDHLPAEPEQRRLF